MVYARPSLRSTLVCGRFRNAVGFTELALWAGRRRKRRESREVGVTTIPGNAIVRVGLHFRRGLILEIVQPR